MQEIKHLKSMWTAKVKRSESLIVPKVSLGSLSNDSWAFNVPYAFRDALDIKYEQRMKEKKPYMIWTQGPLINFNEGDTFTARNNKSAIQIIFATGMGWDTTTNTMYPGSVVLDEFEINELKYTKIKQRNCSQMELLETLIGHQQHRE